MGRLTHTVTPGGLSATDHDRIAALVERRWSANRIAREIGKHPSTVAWHLYNTGLQPPKQTDSPRTYQRGSSTVRQFSTAEDAFITARRLDGLGPTAIARSVEETFGYKRRLSSIRVRLVMLAGLEDA